MLPSTVPHSLRISSHPRFHGVEYRATAAVHAHCGARETMWNSSEVSAQFTVVCLTRRTARQNQYAALFHRNGRCEICGLGVQANGGPSVN
jgi:hypothetical protein